MSLSLKACHFDRRPDPSYGDKCRWDINWKTIRQTVSPSRVDCACFLTECPSNSQGQSAAKRQGKFKKVLIVSS